jgi:hypothetical protein
VLLAVWVVVVVGGITAPAGIESAIEWRIFWMVLPAVVVLVALLTRRILAAWRRYRGRQEAIAGEVAGLALARWPGPPPDPGNARPLDTAARAARAFGKLRCDPLPITTMRVRLAGPVVLLYATDDPSPMLRLPCRLRSGGEANKQLRRQLDQAPETSDQDGDVEDGELDDWDLEALEDWAREQALEDLKRASLAGPLLATVYGLPVLGTYLGVAICGSGDRQESFLLPTGVARRAPRTRLGGWIASYADLLRGAPRSPG